MSDNTVVLLGSLQDYRNDLAIVPELLQDLKQLNSQPFDRLKAVMADLMELRSYQEVKAAIGSAFKAEATESLLRFLTFVAGGDADEFIEDLVERRNKSTTFQKEFSNLDLENLRERLRIIMVPVPCLVKHVKYEKLADIIGNQLCEINIICDMRPVFDQSRKKIESVIPLATLKMSYVTQTGENKVLEITLTGDDMDQLSDTIELAKKEWGVLQNYSNEFFEN